MLNCFHSVLQVTFYLNVMCFVPVVISMQPPSTPCFEPVYALFTHPSLLSSIHFSTFFPLQSQSALQGSDWSLTAAVQGVCMFTCRHSDLLYNVSARDGLSAVFSTGETSSSLERLSPFNFVPSHLLHCKICERCFD